MLSVGPPSTIGNPYKLGAEPFSTDSRREFAKRHAGRNADQPGSIPTSDDRRSTTDQDSSRVRAEDETISIYRARLSRLTAEVKHYRAKLQQRSEEVRRLQAMSTNIRRNEAHVTGDESNITGTTIRLLKRERDDLAALVSQIRQRSTWLLKHNRELIAQLSSSIKLIRILKEDKQTISDHAARLEYEVKTLRNRTNDKTLECNKQITTMLEAESSEFDQLQSRLLQSETELANARTQVEHLKARLKEMESQVLKTKQETQMARDEDLKKLEGANLTIAAVNIQRNEALTELKQLRIRLLDLQTTHSKRIEHLDELYKHAKIRESELECELIAVDEDRHRLVSKATAAANEVTAARQELNELTLKHSLNLKKTAAAAKAREKTLLCRLNDTKATYERRLCETTCLMEQYRKSMEQLKEVYSNGVQQFNIDAKHLTDQQTNTWKFHKKCKRVMKAKVRLEHEMARQLLQIQQSQEHIAVLEKQLKEKNNEIHQLKDNEARLLKDRRILASEFRFIQQQCASDSSSDALACMVNRWAMNLDLEDVLNRTQNLSEWESSFKIGGV